MRAKIQIDRLPTHLLVVQFSYVVNRSNLVVFYLLNLISFKSSTAIIMAAIVGTVTVIKRSGDDGAQLEWNAEKTGLLIGR